MVRDLHRQLKLKQLIIQEFVPAADAEKVSLFVGILFFTLIIYLDPLFTRFYYFPPQKNFLD